MRHALTVALQSFQGEMILVSHDRSLIEATTDQFLLIDSGSLKMFDGDLNDYHAYRLAQSQENNQSNAPVASAHSQNRKDVKRLEAQIRQERAKRTKPIQQEIDKTEKELSTLQTKLSELEGYLADESTYLPENKTNLQQFLTQSAEIKVKLSELEENWLQWQEKLESVNAEIDAEFAH